MATFDVTVRRLARVENHPNADRLELAVVDGYRAVVLKDAFKAGDLIGYIPEAAILPPELIERFGLTGKLAGAEFNRVHAVRLRGALSQGIVFAAEPQWVEGQSVMAELGITKFVPQVPAELEGAVYPLEREEGLSFDVEDIKAWPEILLPGEEVVFTEKLHGVFMSVSALPEKAGPNSLHFDQRSWVSSKGLLQQRMAFITAVDQPNMYVRTANRLGLYEAAMRLAAATGKVAHILGELYGMGVQDLHYGAQGGAPQYRVFAIVLGGRYVDDWDLEILIGDLNLVRAPVLYRGPFSLAALTLHTNGKESVTGQEKHLREGVVITPAMERTDPMLGRVCLKSVSEAYLLRKGGTEYS